MTVGVSFVFGAGIDRGEGRRFGWPQFVCTALRGLDGYIEEIGGMVCVMVLEGVALTVLYRNVTVGGVWARKSDTAK